MLPGTYAIEIYQGRQWQLRGTRRLSRGPMAVPLGDTQEAFGSRLAGHQPPIRQGSDAGEVAKDASFDVVLNSQLSFAAGTITVGED